MSEKITLIKHIKKINYFVLDEKIDTIPLLKRFISDKKSKSIYFTYFAYAFFFKIHNFDNMSSLILGNIILMFRFFLYQSLFPKEIKENAKEKNMKKVFFG